MYVLFLKHQKHVKSLTRNLYELTRNLYELTRNLYDLESTLQHWRGVCEGTKSFKVF